MTLLRSFGCHPHNLNNFLSGTICCNKPNYNILLRSKCNRNFTTVAAVQNKHGVNETKLSSRINKRKFNIPKGPSLKEFISGSLNVNLAQTSVDETPYLDPSHFRCDGRKVYFDVYGCQMNVNDTEVIWSILKDVGFVRTTDLHEADVVLVITCAIREGAENKIWNKLQHLKGLNKARSKSNKSQMKIGILGCMAERLKHKVLEKEQCVDIVVGPDSYRDLPRLLYLTERGQAAVNVILSFDETYADIVPVRLNQDSVTAYISIMRGCDNMCSYCIVPFTRGRERSRPITSIVEEVKILSDQGIKEVTLLGQNVNSYRDLSEVDYFGGLDSTESTHLAKGFRTVYKNKSGGLRFADLLDKVSRINPEMRIRFTSPHPKDFPDEVLYLIRERSNICSNLHMPAQSGSTTVLERMRRGYSREAYIDLIEHTKEIIPNVALSSDFICGFCGETEDEFKDTLSLISLVKFNVGYFFAYSMREKTMAHRTLEDDVPSEIKKRRLQDMTQLFREEALKLNNKCVGDVHLVLVEGKSRRSEDFLAGRNDSNLKVVFPAVPIPEDKHTNSVTTAKPGDYVAVQITEVNAQTLKGTPLYISSLHGFTAETDYQKQSLQHAV